LQIPQDAIVFGRYGGMDDFNINIAKNAIKNYINLDTNVYFLFILFVLIIILFLILV
jgi:hypothetical protein